jgi:hypothetical protein
MSKLAPYRKLIVALLGAALTAAEANAELLGSYGPVVIAALTAVGVYLAKNAPADA